MSTASKAIYEIQAKYTGKGEFKQLTADIKTMGKVESFEKIAQSFAKLNQDFVAAKAKVRELRQEMAKPGNSGMQVEYEKAVAAAAKLSQEIGKQKERLNSARTELQSAGVSVSNLSGEYDRLKKSISSLAGFNAAKNMLGIKTMQDTKAQMAGLVKAYRDIASSSKASVADQMQALTALRQKTRELYATISSPPKLQAARDVLGISSHGAIVAEINKAKLAYQQLASSGKLSMAELAQAKVALGRRLDELRSKTNGWRDALGDLRGRAVEVAGALGAIVWPSKVAIEFESSMSKVKKVIDGTPEEVKALGEELQKMSQTIPLTANELAQIAAAGGQLGIAAKDIQPFVDVTAKMATAFDMTSEEAGDAIGKLKNILGLSIAEMGNFGDAINHLGNNSATNEKKIVEVMLRIGGTSKQFGIAKEQAAALATTMLALGKTPEVAATGINALLSKMQTATMQSNTFQDAMKKIGMSAEEMAKAVEKDPQKAITSLLNTLKKLKGREQAEVITGLFGLEYQDDIAALVQGMGEYERVLGLVADKTKYAGAMQKEFDAKVATTKEQLKLLGSTATRAAEGIGDGFNKLIAPAVKLLTDMLKPVADLTNAFPKLSGALVGFGGGAIILTTAAKGIGALQLAMAGFSADIAAKLGIAGTAAAKFGAVLRMVTIKYVAPFAVGFGIGTWLRQFEDVERAGIAMASGIHKGLMRVKQAWVALRGGDTDAIKREIAEIDAVYAEMFANVGRKSKETSKVQVEEQKKVTDAVVTSVAKYPQATGEALDKMKQQYKEYSEEIKRLQDELLGEEISLDQQLRNLKREGMTDDNAYKDKIKEFREYMAVVDAAEYSAKAAIEKNDLSGAAENIKIMKQFAEQAKSVAGGMATEIKNGDKVILEQAAGIEAKMKLLGEAGGKVFDSIKLQQEALNATKNDLTEKSGFADLSKGLDAYEQQWQENWEKMQAKSIEVVDAVEERIEKMVEKERTVWVNIKERQARSSGGPIGMNNGGLVAALRMASGGAVTAFRNMLSGGHFPGFGGGDRRHVIAEDGEYMLDKWRVRHAGLNTIRALHAGRYDIVIAELSKRVRQGALSAISRSLGGIIDSMPTIPHIGPQYMAAGGAVVGGGENIPPVNITLNYSGGVSQAAARDMATMVMGEFKKIYRGRS